MTRKNTRRNFLVTGAAAAAGVVGVRVFQQVRQKNAQPPEPLPEVEPIPERTLGETGVVLPMFGLGGAGRTPLSKEGQEREAQDLIEGALQLGIRYFDTAADYGPSEKNLGKVLAPYRDRLFIASKTAVRDRDGAWRELERSLRRLKTDYLDLWQLHHVSLPEENEEIFSQRGAIHAIEEAKEQGLVRLVGITGHHDPDVIVEGLRRYRFDTTLIPVNAVEIHHPHSFVSTVMPVAREQNLGTIAMKVPAWGRLLQPGLLDGMHQALGYTLSVPGVHSCIVAVENLAQLEQNITLARQFELLDEEAMVAISQRTAADWEELTFYRAWT
ncbi:MAG: aldo/keto reductase [Cyanobacteria bacterium SID2]|nr:aldo/keto reductase [Cyanobacteria bacterium SID2]MBP0006626.1 aldo/keto reductase [Cyanobacteria bacterium SBC]